MILIVGAGSSLMSGQKDLESRLGADILFMSRQKPKSIEEGSWIGTDYDPFGDSLTNLQQFTDIRTIVWLASPLHRGLLMNQENEALTQNYLSGTLFQTLLVKSKLPQMVSSNFGRFVFAGSSGAKVGSPGAVVYMQLKAAQAALSRGLAIEYGAAGITSNVINLGVINRGYSDGLPASVLSKMLSRTPAARKIDPDEFWELVIGILSNSALNGAEINLDGGYY